MALRREWEDRVDIVFEPGCGAGTEPTPLEPWELTNARGEPGFLVEYWADTEMRGAPVAVHNGDDFRIQYLGPPGDDVPYPHFAARAAATFTARRRVGTCSCSARTPTHICSSTARRSST